MIKIYDRYGNLKQKISADFIFKERNSAIVRECELCHNWFLVGGYSKPGRGKKAGSHHNYLNACFECRRGKLTDLRKSELIEIIEQLKIEKITKKIENGENNEE